MTQQNGLRKSVMVTEGREPGLSSPVPAKCGTARTKPSKAGRDLNGGDDKNIWVRVFPPQSSAVPSPAAAPLHHVLSPIFPLRR